MVLCIFKRSFVIIFKDSVHLSLTNLCNPILLEAFKCRLDYQTYKKLRSTNGSVILFLNPRSSHLLNDLFTSSIYKIIDIDFIFPSTFTSFFLSISGENFLFSGTKIILLSVSMYRLTNSSLLLSKHTTNSPFL